MDFGAALNLLKQGLPVSRSGWNGKGMYLLLVTERDWTCEVQPDGTRLLPWIGMKTADGSFVPWLASQTDLLALDWSRAERP